MFERAHHQRIARLLAVLDAGLLRQANCLFGGGTAIALRYGEYRESVDIDFLVSDVASYRSLRLLLTGPNGFAGLLRAAVEPVTLVRDIRADQYGIRTIVAIDELPIKFEIVLEGRFALEAPGVDDEIGGIASLSPIDLATSKLLANADRWSDDGVFSRDVIDLAMMRPSLPLLRAARAKAEVAYGEAVSRELGRAIDKLQTRRDWLERCMSAMAMTLPKAVVWNRIRALRRVL